ncbi:WYL domain-containing protein [Actinomycetaceae bacterium TAE3-ERU4]|nr:WYL domain-containing protein [Actinomycetaceae bacterium TAE3-ERU4]
MADSVVELARRLALLAFLEKTGPVSITQCAEHFQVSNRQIRKWVAELSLSGFATSDTINYFPAEMIDFDFEAYDRGILSISQTQSITCVRPREDQINLILLALRVAVSAGLVPLQEIIELYTTLCVFTSEDTPLESIVDFPAQETLIGQLDSVRSALEGIISSPEYAAEIEYLDSNLDLSKRIIYPSSFRVDDGLVYLEAYCFFRQANRSFRLDRILTCQKVGLPMDELPSFSEDTSQASSNSVNVKITFSAVSSRLAEDLGWPKPLRVANEKQEIELEVFSLRWLCSVLLRNSSLCLSVSPPEIKNQLLDMLSKALEDSTSFDKERKK